METLLKVHKTEQADLVDLPGPRKFLLPFSSQKSHVKLLSHLTHFHTTTSALQIRYAQSAILNIEIKTSEPRLASGANSFYFQYFGRNSFVVNILRRTTCRNLLIIFGLRTGNKGGTPS